MPTPHEDPEETSHPIEDPIPDPEPASPSLPGPDEEIYINDIETTAP